MNYIAAQVQLLHDAELECCETTAPTQDITGGILQRKFNSWSTAPTALSRTPLISFL